jgi:hypothetical protein
MTWTAFAATPSVSPIDAVWERVVIEEPVDLLSTSRCFATVDITLPDMNGP